MDYTLMQATSCPSVIAFKGGMAWHARNYSALIPWLLHLVSW